MPPPELLTVRGWYVDSSRWSHYTPAAGDVVVATHGKCGTTWTQRIVDLLLAGDPAPRSIHGGAPWLDLRIRPLHGVLAAIAAQPGRKHIKSHLSADALPIHDGVLYINCQRDGRDAAMSAHNHIKSYKPAMLENIDAAGLSDPLIRAPYPREAQDPAEFFSGWVEDMDAVPEVKEPGIAVVKGTPSYLHIARTWWELRDRPNVLLLHYNDLKADLDGEMRRIGRFLGVAIDEDVWPSLVEAARFESMKRDAELLSPGADAVFEGGAATFFHKGTNGRWKGVVRESDLAEYDRKLATLDPVLREWLTKGRLASGVSVGKDGP